MKSFVVFRNLVLVWSICTVSLSHLNAQCSSSFGSYLTFPCSIDTASIPKLTVGTVTGCANVTSVEPVLPFQTVMNGCSSGCFSVLYRQWLIRINGQPNQFLNDTICFTAVTLDDVVCPSDTLVYCNSAASLDTSVSALGSPLHNHGIPCNLLQSGPSQIIWFNGANGCIKFTRQWYVLDWCNPGRIDTCRQTVEVRDTVDPTIVVASKLADASTSGDACTAKVNFPAALISDNCASLSQIKVKIVIAGQTLNANGGLISNIPMGDHMAIYTADDGCGNTSSDTSLISIKDNVGPVAICKSAKTIQLGQAGMLTLPATAFDDGSFDLCTSPITLKVKRIPSSSFCAVANNQLHRFDDQVKFCCMDANQDIMVILRVYQGLLPLGTISVDAFVNPYTECMVMVKVLDVVGPQISCPADTTIDCRDLTKKRVKSLTNYGVAIVSDMCLDTVWVDSLPSLDGCNRGKIIRRINARDEAGNVSFCNQTITVTNSDPFDGNDSTDIYWPRDTTFFVCSANVGSSVTGLPIVLDPNCSQLVFKSEDEIYEFTQFACKKIIRRWTVTDWCQLSDIDPNAGKWYHMQKIVVMDTVKPVITVPAAFTVNNFDSLCGPTFVNVPLPSATDCTPVANLVWTYTLDLFNDGVNGIPGSGKAASQSMPNGIHSLEFKVSDQCGNTTIGKTLITVKDAKKPTAVVMHGLATDVSLMNGVAMSRVHARLFFIPSVMDNCTPFNKLKFSFSPNTNDTFRIYTCDSLGTRLVRLYITDEAGNQDWVNSYILIQNNMGACGTITPLPGPQTTAIDGKLKTEWGSMIEQVGIKLMHDHTAMPDLMVNGKYTLSNLNKGENYEIIPRKDVNPLNGVSTLDLIMIQKHILGVQSFHSPYKLIAADIDKNGEVNGLDLVELRKLILGINKTFLNNESWRFIDAGYRFLNPTKALQEAFNEKYLINNLQKPMQIDFVGVKIGDVNESTTSEELQHIESRELPLSKAFIAENRGFQPEEIIQFDLFTENGMAFTGFQLDLLTSDLEFVSAQGGLIPMNNIFINKLNAELRLAIHQTSPLIAAEKRPLLSLYFKASKSGYLKNSIKINAVRGMQPELYDQDLKIYPIHLKWKDRTDSQMQLFQNRPNPFFQETHIQFHLPGATAAILKIVNLDGSLIYQKQINGQAGINEWTIDKSIFKTSGIYYYRLESIYGTSTRKMILLN